LAEKWYRRFGDIDSVTYEPLVAVDVAKIRGVGVEPETLHYDTGDSLWWPAIYERGGGETSASPVAQRDFGAGKWTLSRAIRYVAETVELPGTASDYHFCIQGAVEDLWKHRRESVEVLDAIERLAWLDINFVTAVPEAITWKRDGETLTYAVSSWSRLIMLYRLEGAWRDALDIALMAEAAGHRPVELDELVERVALLVAETDGAT
jgi:hypothetical protein